MNKKLISEIQKLTKKTNCKAYLVGGALRDILLKRKTNDMDIVIDEEAKLFAEKLSKKLSSTLFALNREKDAWRLVFREGGTVDFTNMKGSIEQDLQKRDYTIDAMALQVTGHRSQVTDFSNIIDPSGGMKDLRRKIIRKVSNRIFDEDPLRLLRAWRLAATLQFKVEKDTEALIKKKAKLIRQTAQERIREELLKILSGKTPVYYIDKIEDAGILQAIIPEIKLMHKSPENYFHKRGLWGHSLATLKASVKIEKNIGKIFPGLKTKINQFMSQKSGGFPRWTLLRWLSLFHDIGKPSCAKRTKEKVRFFGHEERGAEILLKIMERLRFSNAEIRIGLIACQYHMRPGNLSGADRITDRAIYRYFRDLGDTGIDCSLLSLADRLSYQEIKSEPEEIKKQKLVSRRLIRSYFFQKEKVQPKPIINGNQIMKHFCLASGPHIGRLLSSLKEAQVAGKVKTEEEAKRFVESMLDPVPEKSRSRVDTDNGKK